MGEGADTTQGELAVPGVFDGGRSQGVIEIE